MVKAVTNSGGVARNARLKNRARIETGEGTFAVRPGEVTPGLKTGRGLKHCSGRCRSHSAL